MYFVLQTPSLEHLAGVKIVAHLWNRSEIMSQIEETFNDLDDFEPSYVKEEWKPMEDQVNSKVSTLPLPQLYKERLCNLIKPLSMEVVDWCLYHSGGNPHRVVRKLLPPEFSWTMHGTIDHLKTAELMVKNDRLNMYCRLEFACVYGLKDEARELIELVPRDRRQEYCVNTLRNVMREDFYFLVVLITDTINADGIDAWDNEFSPFGYLSAKLIDAKNLIVNHLPSGNRAMCKYLFQTLDREEQERILKYCKTIIYSCKKSSTCSLLYYLSLMNEEQQEYMFRECIIGLLLCLLRWPTQSLFLEAAKCGWKYINKDDYSTVLLAITRKICRGFRDDDYSRLFWECWCLIPADDVPYVLCNDVVLESLLHTIREDFIKLIFNEAPSRHILALCTRYHKISHGLMDESCNSQAALMECSKNEGDEEKRLRSEYLDRLVDLAMKSRVNRK